MPNPQNTDETSQDNAATGAPLQLVIEALNRMKYGAIQLTVHEGRLVQVDVTERNRFPG